MKQLIKLTLLATALLIGGCSDKKEKITFTTVDIATDWRTSQYTRLTVKKVVKDGVSKLYTTVVDTLRDDHRQPLYDSSRKVKLGQRWEEIPSEFIIAEFDIDWEKRTSDFIKRITPDSTKK